MNTGQHNLLKGFYHCPECDALFESDVKVVAGLKCLHCGRCLTDNKSNSINQTLKSTLDEAPLMEAVLPEEVQRRVRQKRKSRKKTIWLSIIFIALLSPVFFYDPDEDEGRGVQEEVEEKLSPEEAELVMSGCFDVYKKFIAASEVSELVKSIYKPALYAEEINRYYDENSLFIRAKNHSGFNSFTYIRKSEPHIIGASYKSEAGKNVEVSFIKFKDGYKIDWPYHVRYNEIGLEEFLKKEKGSESDFRLYMRVLDIDDQLTFVFYPPKTNKDNSVIGMKSSSLRLPKESKEGARILSILNDEDGVGSDYRKVISRFDPEGYHRVRVRLAVSTDEKGRVALELVEFIANDWYSVDINSEKL